LYKALIGVSAARGDLRNSGEFLKLEQCVSEGLSGLLKNRSRIVPGRLNRIMNALVPASLARKMEADMLGKGLASKSALASARGEA
jgi:uncharacterized protein